jgi:hypothetical protein
MRARYSWYFEGLSGVGGLLKRESAGLGMKKGLGMKGVSYEDSQTTQNRGFGVQGTKKQTSSVADAARTAQQLSTSLSQDSQHSSRSATVIVTLADGLVGVEAVHLLGLIARQRLIEGRVSDMVLSQVIAVNIRRRTHAARAPRREGIRQRRSAFPVPV